MIRIAICDDSSSDANNLKTTCEACNLPYSLDIRVYNCGKQLLADLPTNNYDIVFLDIDMPEQNGIQIGMKTRQLLNNSIIIFCTSYPQYAIEAFDCEPFHYLLKPISIEKLETVLNRAIAKYKITKKYLKIKIQNKVIQLPISEILYIEYCRKHILYHTENRVIETVGRFSDVLDELINYGFYQVHQGYIVNFAKVQDFCGYSVILNNGQSVMISVRKKSEVLLAYANYVEAFQ